MLSTVGDQVPVIPLFEVAGKTGTALPLQKLFAMVKVGATVVVTVTFKVNGAPHCPAAGVNKYAPFAVLLITLGDQVPVIPLFEVVGKAGAVVPLHKVVGRVNVGVMLLLIATFKVNGALHCPAAGVNK